MEYIDIGAKWCLPCLLMKEDVYTDKDISKIMNDNFISYLVDAEGANGPNMTVRFISNPNVLKYKRTSITKKS